MKPGFMTLLLFALAAGPSAATEIPDEAFGIGILVPPDLDLGAEHLPYPIFDVPLLNTPAGAEVGRLHHPRFDDESWHPLSATLNDGQAFTDCSYGMRHHSADYCADHERMDYADFAFITYRGHCLVFHERRDGYVRILDRTLPDGAWVELAALERVGIVPSGWLPILAKTGGPFFERVGGLNLRAGPGGAHERLITMTGMGWVIQPTGEQEGAWFHVTALRTDGNPCCSWTQELNRHEGWIKAVDDAGFPNVWFCAGGC